MIVESGTGKKDYSLKFLQIFTGKQITHATFTKR